LLNHLYKNKKMKEKYSMKKMWKVLVISMVIAGVLATVLAVTISAAGPRNNSSGNSYGQGGGSVLDEVSQLLGLTPEQIKEQRQAGQSLAQIAAARNINEEALVNAILAGRQAAILKLVEAGTLSQDQADQRLALMQERVRLAVNRSAVGPPDWAGNDNNRQNRTGNGKGLMGRGGSRGNQENCTGTQGKCTGNSTQDRLRIHDQDCTGDQSQDQIRAQDRTFSGDLLRKKLQLKDRAC
jgi:hypothetical protein